MPLSCSVVICTRNRPILLNRCLESVARLDYPAFDVLVVDNAPTDRRTREIAFRWGCKYHLEPMPGLSKARNAGTRLCKADVVSFLDDDEIADPGWLETLTQEFSNPLVMAATGRIRAIGIETKTDRTRALIAGPEYGAEGKITVDR